MAKVGRGNKLPLETLDRVLSNIRERGMFIHDAAREAGVHEDTIWRYAREDPDGFGVEFQSAKEALAHHLAQQSVTLLDQGSANDVEDPKRASAHVTLLSARSRARTWLASKWLPSTYGEKIEHSGQIGQAVTIMLPPLEPLPQRVASRIVPQLGEGNATPPSETLEGVAEVLPDDG